MKSAFENFRIFYRGIKQLHHLSPYNLLAKCIRSICHALIPFANLWMSAWIIDSLVAKNDLSQLITLVFITVGVNLALVLLEKQMDAVNYRKWNEFYLRYNFSIGEKVQSLPYEKIEDENTHWQIKNIDDAMKIGNYGLIKLHSRIPLFLENFSKVILSFGMILSVVSQKSFLTTGILQTIIHSTYGDMVLFSLIALTAFISIFANRKVSKKTYIQLGNLSKENRVLDYYLNHYLDGHKAGKDIRLYRQDRLILDEVNLVSRKNSCIVNGINRTIFWSKIGQLFSDVLLFFYSYLYIAVKSMSGLLGVGSIVKYSGNVLMFAGAFSGMIDAASQLWANMKYLKDYFAFIDLPEAEPSKMNLKTITAFENIEFNHVTFRYPSAKNDALKGISFRIERGEKIAVVGHNGSGKTTMIKLLSGLHQPTSGTISLNGINIEEYNSKEYRSLYGIAFQDFKLFSLPLGQNVSTNTEYDKNRAKKVLVDMGMGERLNSMKTGLETYLYQDFDNEGVEVSGGEAQKIALARALYRNPPIILLDEPTAALDPRSEAEIYARFNQIAKNKTVVFISHRLSSCRFCDRILVFSDGEIVQQGSHESLLLDKTGVYFKLWNSQAKYYQ